MEDNKPTNEVANVKKEVELTEQNWLMLKYLREGKRIREAYSLAGYTGSANACYQLYHILKGKLKEIVEADGFNKTRLAIEMEKLISLPLELNKTEVTLTEKLKAIRLANQIISDDAQKSPQATFTLIVIGNEPNEDKGPQGAIVDVEDMSQARQDGDDGVTEGNGQ